MQTLKTYILDFTGQVKLAEEASKLDGKTVQLTGTREPDSLTIRVTGMKEVETEFVKETVTVEIQGELRIHEICFPSLPPICGVDFYEIVVKDKSYRLEFARQVAHWHA